MAYEEILASEIEVGKAVKKELWRKTRNSLIDHEQRIAALSLGAAPVEVFNLDIANASSSASLTGVVNYKAITNFTVNLVEVQIFEKGGITSGFLTIDVKKNTSLDDLGMTSILTTLPSINFSLFPDYSSSAGILNPALQTVVAGEFLRLDITSLPITPLGRFRVVVYGVI